MGRLDGLKEKAPGLHRFLTRRDRPWPLVREVLGGLLVILLLVSLLYGFTGQPLSGGYPVVVVTSGSMMHCANGDPATGVGPSYGKDCDASSFGRVGTIDPGDLVFVRAVAARSDVHTMAQEGGDTYGKAGDVVVYRPYGSTAGTPIIHRALFWLQVNADGTFDVAELGLRGVSSLDQPVLTNLTRCALATRDVHGALLASSSSGFITRGDNNAAADQCPGAAKLTDPVQMAWVLGKARGELPWIGLVKLFVDGIGGSPNFANAAGDTKLLMLAVVAVLLGGPWAVERVLKSRRSKDPPASPPPAR